MPDWVQVCACKLTARAEQCARVLSTRARGSRSSRIAELVSDARREHSRARGQLALGARQLELARLELASRARVFARASLA